MKTIVSVQEIDELEIRPRSEVSEWRRLVALEIETRWRDRSGWVTVCCPCCTASGSRSAFIRIGIAYVECSACGTLYAPHRPDEEALATWYRDSLPGKYWREQLLAASSETRHEKIVLPRAQWVSDGIAEYVPGATRLLDVGANSRAFVNEVVSANPALEALVAGATADLEGRSDGSIEVRPTPVAGFAALGQVDLVTALDVIDRATHLPTLIRAIHSALAPGGVLFATLPVASGFEIQALWDRSPSVIPPDKVNLPTVAGLLELFSGPSWELHELSTPGNFDVEIVHRTISQTPDADWPRALRALVVGADPDARNRFTEYLQSRRLSSFARLVACRRG